MSQWFSYYFDLSEFDYKISFDTYKTGHLFVWLFVKQNNSCTVVNMLV